MKLYNLLQIRTTLNAHTKDTMSTMLAYKIMKFIKLTEAEENFNNEIYVYDTKILYQRYKFLENELQEHFILLLLNNQNKIIKEVKLYKGTSDQISINTKDILREILTSKATKFAIVHNHPNDNEKASFDDKETTLKLIKLAKEFDVILYDHLIIYQGGYYSFLHKKT